MMPDIPPPRMATLGLLLSGDRIFTCSFILGGFILFDGAGVIPSSSRVFFLPLILSESTSEVLLLPLWLGMPSPGRTFLCIFLLPFGTLFDGGVEDDDGRVDWVSLWVPSDFFLHSIPPPPLPPAAPLTSPLFEPHCTVRRRRRRRCELRAKKAEVVEVSSAAAAAAAEVAVAVVGFIGGGGGWE